MFIDISIDMLIDILTDKAEGGGMKEGELCLIINSYKNVNYRMTTPVSGPEKSVGKKN